MGINLKALLRRNGDRPGDKVAKLPLGGGDAANDLLDVVYHSILDGSRKAVRLSTDSTVRPSYTLLVARRERRFVTYAKKTKGGYATSYDMTDYVLAPYPETRSTSQVYRFSQDETGKMSLYQMPTADASEGIPLTSGRVSYALDPICAWIHGNEVFLVTNIPSESTAGGTIEQRVPVPRDRYATASGYLCVMRIDAISGKNRPVFETSEDVRNYCATVIPHRGSGRPGLLVYNTMFPKPKKETLPTSFEQLVDSVSDKDEPIAPPRDIPIGASIYDFEMGAFARVPLDGRPEWGINKIEFAEDDETDEDEPPRIFIVDEAPAERPTKTSQDGNGSEQTPTAAPEPDAGTSTDGSTTVQPDADASEGQHEEGTGDETSVPPNGEMTTAPENTCDRIAAIRGAHYKRGTAVPATVPSDDADSPNTDKKSDDAMAAALKQPEASAEPAAGECDSEKGVKASDASATDDGGQTQDKPSDAPEVMAPISIPAFLEASRGRSRKETKGQQRRSMRSRIQLTESEIRSLETMGILRKDVAENKPGEDGKEGDSPADTGGKKA